MLDEVKMIPWIIRRRLLGTLVGKTPVHFKNPFPTFAASINRMILQEIVN